MDNDEITYKEDIEKLNKIVSELRDKVTDVLVEQAEHRGTLKDFSEWRIRFTDDIKDTLRAMSSKSEKDMSEMEKSLHGLNEKLDKNNKEINDKIDKNNKEILKEIKDNSEKQEKFIKSVVRIGVGLIVTVLLAGSGYLVQALIALIYHK